ncbi:MAG TPA: hypothetical protein VLQ93_25450 [Myxococcaceae bacterium]|nr:hypothetical protein [Myxococcaceae bacterium]
MRLPLRYPLLLASLALPTSTALAHAGLPETTSVTVRHGHPEDLFVGATFGALVSRDSGKSWRWVCPQAMGYNWSPQSYLWQSTGQLLAASGTSLLRSQDGGCSWETHDFFSSQGLWPTHVASLPSHEARVWVSTGRPNVPNALYRSDDGGDTFTATSLRREDARFSAVVLAPSDPRRLYVSATTAAGLSLFRSDDEGASWVELPQPLPTLTEPYNFTVLQVAEGHPEHLWARASSQGYTWLLESHDGGHTLQPVLQLDEVLINMESSADGLTVWAATPTRLYRVREDTPASFLPFPEGNACVHREGDSLLVCGSTWVHGWALARTRDEGTTWEPLFSLEETQGPLSCPAGTPTRELCEPRWPQFAPSLGANPYPNGPPPDAGTPGETPPAPKPEGCSATGGELATWLLPLAALLPSRRRHLERRRR